MKLLKILFAIAALVIVVCVVAAVCLVMFIDPNQLKPVLAQEITKQTGYQVKIEGKLAWSFYPKVGIAIDHMIFTNPKQATPFMDLRNVTMAADLSQLLHGNQTLNGDVRIADATLMNVHAYNANVGLHWENNVLTLNPINASLYDGTLSGIAHGRDLSATPKWDWDMKLSRIQIKPLLRDLNGDDAKLKLSGESDVNFKATTQGKGKDQLTKNLNGTCDFSLRNGVLEGIDINYFIQTADALINKQPVPTVPSVYQTAFDNFNGSATITQGVAESKNISLTSSAFAVAAEGSVNLVNESLDFQLHVKPQQNPRIQWQIPMLVTGNVAHPEVRLDTTELQKYIVGQQITKVKAKVQDEIKKRVPGKAGEFLQNLLGK